MAYYAGKFATRKFGKEGSSPLFVDYNGCETCCRLIMRVDKLGTTPKLECTTYCNTPVLTPFALKMYMMYIL